MSAPPYMKLFWGDYHKKTRHLKRAAQHGAYFLLIGEAWQQGGALPDDDEKLAAWACCTDDEWATMKPGIMSFFSLRRGKWVHDRVREELASYESTSRKRKEAGRKGGSVSKGKDEENPEANAKQKPIKPEPESEPLKEEGKPSSKKKPSRSIPADFPDEQSLAAAKTKIIESSSTVDADREAERFRNWAISKDAKYADWTATFRNWIAKAIELAPKRAGSVTAAQPNWEFWLETFMKKGSWSTASLGSPPTERDCEAPADLLLRYGFIKGEKNPPRGRPELLQKQNGLLI